MSRANRNRYLAEFAKADADNSGHICKDELRAVLDSLGKEQADLDRMFAKVDSDSSGQIDEREFLIFMEDVDNAWIRVQKKTFTRWANTVLSNRMLSLDDITYDLRNGVLIKPLVEVLAKKQLPKINPKPKMRLQNMENLNKTLDFLKSDGVKLVNVGADDITDGNERITLGLIWMLILKYQIGDSCAEGSPKWLLLEWVKKQIAPYNTGVKLKNFKRGWSDGKVLSALADSLGEDFNGTINVPEISSDPYEASKHAMDTAENTFDIPKIMDPVDIVENPEEHSIMTYVSYFRDWADNMKNKASAQTTTASGPGVEGGECGGKTDFIVETRNKQGDKLKQGGDPVSVQVTGPDGNVVPSDLKDNGDGTYSGSYPVDAPGDYVVDVRLKNEPIKDSAFTARMEAGNPAHCYAEGDGLTKGKTARPCEFCIFSVDKNGNRVVGGGDPFQVEILGPSGVVAHEITDLGDGTYPCKYAPDVEGEYKISIKLFDTDIDGSPYTAKIKRSPNADKSYVAGPGLKRAYDNKPTYFTVHAMDDLGQPVSGDDCTVTIVPDDGQAGLEPIPVDVVDNGDGTYRCDYAPAKAGQYTINVQLDGDDVQGTPCPLKVRVGADASKTGAAKFKVTIVARDKEGNAKTEGGDEWEVEIADAEGADVPCKFKDNGDGSYSAEYSLCAATDGSGPKEYAVTMKLAGDNIQGSPFKQFM